MNKQERIDALDWLGHRIADYPDLETILDKAKQRNGFFIPEFSRLALQNISSWMQKEMLDQWLSGVSDLPQKARVGLVLAGNIPLVGWHDLMSVFASGHIACYKPSQADEVLIDFLVNQLCQQFPQAIPYFRKVERLNEVDALIVTGTRTTGNHFDYYFRTRPRLIRGSRSSLALIYGFETEQELSLLCDDVMQYFGMGCRSVTKFLVPQGYEFDSFFRALEKYRYLTGHHKFQNNAIYHKSIFLMNGDPFLDNDILMLREEKSLFTPPAVVNFEVYQTMEEARIIVDQHRPDLQCMVSHKGQYPGSIPFGTAQKPGISDYADGIDTLSFLKSIG